MPLNPSVLRNLRGEHAKSYEYALFNRDVQLGADGSILRDGDSVYVLHEHRLDRRINIIDEFLKIGPHIGCPMARLGIDWDLLDVGYHLDGADEVPAVCLIPLETRGRYPGILTKRIIAIQRLWRSTWKVRHHKDIIELALFFKDLYERSRREGIIIPSLDYEQKVAARRYGGAWKRRRACERETRCGLMTF